MQVTSGEILVERMEIFHYEINHWNNHPKEGVESPPLDTSVSDGQSAGLSSLHCSFAKNA